MSIRFQTTRCRVPSLQKDNRRNVEPNRTCAAPSGPGLACNLRRASTVIAFIVAILLAPPSSGNADDNRTNFLATHCQSCHAGDSPESGLDLASLKFDPANSGNFAKWVRIYERIQSGEMPPRDEPRPNAAEISSVAGEIRQLLIVAERERFAAEGRTGVRRLTRAEYENTIRDLFEMPGIALAANLPADGSANGFDKNADALDISHVNLAKYMEAADHVLDLAIATRPEPPTVQKRRLTLANSGGFVAHVLMNGDGVLLKNMQIDPDFPPAGEYRHIDEGAHERIGSFTSGSSVALFRHEDESFSPYFAAHVTIYPGLYRVRTSFWSFLWDQGKILEGRGTEAARLSVVQLTGDGRGGQHPSYVLGYYDAPSLQPTVHEELVWLNWNEILGFNTASLAPAANYARKGHAMSFTGPAIVCDWLDIEGPLHRVWPPPSHQLLFGQLPLAEFRAADHPNVRPPVRKQVRQIGAGRNRPDPVSGLFTVMSEQPLVDADRLLASVLPRLFRRPVEDELRREYVARAAARLQAGDSFEGAMRSAYRAALCSPDFLYHLESAGPLDGYALASRLSYFLWNSLPDERLAELAAKNELSKPDVLRGEVDRLLGDRKSQRFIDDFVGQWLLLRKIASTDPDRKLYPEFNPYLQDSMVAETRAYFRELLDKNLDATYLVRSDFAMLNEKLATHYGIPGVSGSQIRRVELPADCPRGPFLTQASILKITANGTTTSPVPRGAFVMDRLLGQPPDPPPANIPGIEPDVRGAKTIREQLELHRANVVCATCHSKMDPPGFALESFDVIGGLRDRYRSIGEGDDAPRGSIDPFIGISFKLGPKVDTTGQLPDGRTFRGVQEFQQFLAADPDRLMMNLARQFLIYSTGRAVAFSDREEIAAIVARTNARDAGLRTLLYEVIASPLFQTR